MKIKLNSKDPEKTNLPHIRLEYRKETWEIEKKLISQLSEIKEGKKKKKKILKKMKQMNLFI